MADQNKTSPRKHGGRVHRYGPQSTRRRANANNSGENQQITSNSSNGLNNNSITTTSSLESVGELNNSTPVIEERTVIGADDKTNNNMGTADVNPRDDSNGGSDDILDSNGQLPERIDGDGSSFSDREDQDQETEELARLRCPSERTEVIAEREQRRRRRCADYPGLAFGSSIFSSDTLMKFSIIKNELHNILNSQLKRVSTV